MKERRIPKTTRKILITSAVIVDLMQWSGITLLFPGVVGTIVPLSFYIIFKKYGISFSGSKKMKRLGSSIFIELIPVLDAIIPAYTYNVWKTLKENGQNTEPQQLENQQ